MQNIVVDLNRASLTDRVYETIIELLINHKIKPGEKIGEKYIARTMQVSRTPVREAIQRLATNGFVVIYPRRGAYAKKISPRDITELYEVRRCLEVYAAKRAMNAIPEKVVRRIDKIIKRCRLAKGADLGIVSAQFDREIHRVISTYSGNNRIQEILVNLNHVAHLGRIVQLNYQNREFAHRNILEHTAIWEAIKARDKRKIAVLLNRHLRNSEKGLLKHLHMIPLEKEAVDI